MRDVRIVRSNQSCKKIFAICLVRRERESKREKKKANMNDDDEDDEQKLRLLLSSNNDTSKERQKKIRNQFALVLFYFDVLIDSPNESTGNFLFLENRLSEQMSRENHLEIKQVKKKRLPIDYHIC